MNNSYKFFENTECQYYPCHKDLEYINCLFCYCPLYGMKECPGDNRFIISNEKKCKDCSNCTFPHKPENYDIIVSYLSRGIK